MSQMHTILPYVTKLHLEQEKTARRFLELEHKFNEQLADINLAIATQPGLSKIEDKLTHIITELKVRYTYNADCIYIFLYTYDMCYSGNKKPIADQHTINGKHCKYPGTNCTPTIAE